MKTKLVRESLNFERGLDPKEAMNLGIYEKIREWMDEIWIGQKDFQVNKDFTIDTDMNVIIQVGSYLFPDGVFPEYIRFNTSGSFDIDDCNLKSLIGCPKHVRGYFSCQMNDISSLEGFPEIVDQSVYFHLNKYPFSKEDIEKVCTAKRIEIDDDE